MTPTLKSALVATLVLGSLTASFAQTLGSAVGKDLASYKKIRGMKFTTTKGVEKVMEPGRVYADDELAKLPDVEVVYFKGNIARLGEISGRQNTKDRFVRDWELVFSGAQPTTWRAAMARIGLRTTNVKAKQIGTGAAKSFELSGTYRGGRWSAEFVPKNSDFGGRGVFKMTIIHSPRS